VLPFTLKEMLHYHSRNAEYKWDLNCNGVFFIKSQQLVGLEHITEHIV